MNFTESLPKRIVKKRRLGILRYRDVEKRVIKKLKEYGKLLLVKNVNKERREILKEIKELAKELSGDILL